MRLEALASRPSDHGGGYEFDLRSGGIIDPAPIWPAILHDLDRGIDHGRIAGRFHTGLGVAFARVARALVESGQAKAVALSGGCFQNATLLGAVLWGLADVPVLTHRSVPANDGGLAFGQALIAAARGCAG